MALSSVGSMRHRLARRSRAFACEGVRGTSARIGDHTVPHTLERPQRPVSGFFEYRSNKIIRWRFRRKSHEARWPGISLLRGRLAEVYTTPELSGQAGFFGGKLTKRSAGDLVAPLAVQSLRSRISATMSVTNSASGRVPRSSLSRWRTETVPSSTSFAPSTSM